jgi:5-methyltetrahydropteroyltriglutamate--homocysteine methyltransferase
MTSSADPRLLPTTLVGSYPQPDWLIDRQRLAEMVVPRARAHELWRVDDTQLEQAQDDATVLAVRDQERAGIDIVTDGEMRRESYSNRFATALEGMDNEHPAEIPARVPGRFQIVPRVVGKIRRRQPVQVRDVAFLRAQTDRPIKITIPGPFTMTQQVHDEHYKDEAALAMDCAAALNEEIKELFAAGADVVQLDEPFLQAQPDKARRFAIPAINRAVAGAAGTTALHLCFGYAARVASKPSGYSFLPELEGADVDQVSIESAQPRLDCAVLAQLPSRTIILGVLDLADPTAEPAETVAQRIRNALPYVAPERLVIAPDCGMKYLSRELTFAKIVAMVQGAAIVRRELNGSSAADVA